MDQYPRTIDNGHGEQLTFRNRVLKDNVWYLEVENCIAPGSGPPLHVHFMQDEMLTVSEGKMGVHIPGTEPRFVGEGETVHFQRGVVHRFWNAGETNLKCKGEVWPAHNFEYFITEIFNSAKANKNGRPGAFDAAYLMSLYKKEFDMAEIPGFVKKVIFPLTVFIGRLRGLHKKYDQAPPPIH